MKYINEIKVFAAISDLEIYKKKIYIKFAL